MCIWAARVLGLRAMFEHMVWQQAWDAELLCVECQAVDKWRREARGWLPETVLVSHRASLGGMTGRMSGRNLEGWKENYQLVYIVDVKW